MSQPLTKRQLIDAFVEIATRVFNDNELSIVSSILHRTAQPALERRDDRRDNREVRGGGRGGRGGRGSYGTGVPRDDFQNDRRDDRPPRVFDDRREERGRGGLREGRGGIRGGRGGPRGPAIGHSDRPVDRTERTERPARGGRGGYRGGRGGNETGAPPAQTSAPNGNGNGDAPRPRRNNRRPKTAE